MTLPTTPDAIDLRQRAVARLQASTGQEAAALAVLHGLAAAPATASDALAVLHELQVHQVELDLQAEELMRARAELEGALQRQRQLYDSAPAGYFTLDRHTRVHELNRHGAGWLGDDRDALVGRPLDDFLTAPGSLALHTVLERVAAGARGAGCTLHFRAGARSPGEVRARVEADPAGDRFLVVCMDTSPSGTA